MTYHFTCMDARARAHIGADACMQNAQNIATVKHVLYCF